jgi:hypothetical protein
VEAVLQEEAEEAEDDGWLHVVMEEEQAMEEVQMQVVHIEWVQDDATEGEQHIEPLFQSTGEVQVWVVLVKEEVMVMQEWEWQEGQGKEQEQEHHLLKVGGQPIVVEDWQAGTDIAPYIII